MKYVIIIPARFKSSRFPGKPLVDILGKSMIQRTYEQCLLAVPKDIVYVATDNLQIYDHCLELSMNVLLTSDNCLTGTDRVAEVSKIIEADYYINVQGDEPIFNPDDITTLIRELMESNENVINGYCEIESLEQYLSVSIPKVVFRPDGRLLYMSRSPIPGNKNSQFIKGWRQVCIYAFSKIALNQYCEQVVKTPLEFEEDIEILRFLELGFEIKMIKLSSESQAIDNPEDLEKVLNKLERV
jgi:3-deoxy-manno-octulosonate cytidylyltransferase (CMP-KDO synthetase)